MNIHKKIIDCYHNNIKVELTYNNRIIIGKITSVNHQVITLEKKEGVFHININNITKVVKL